MIALFPNVTKGPWDEVVKDLLYIDLCIDLIGRKIGGVPSSAASIPYDLASQRISCAGIRKNS